MFYQQSVAGQQLSEVQQLVQASGKMVLMDKLLPKLRAEGHKVRTACQQSETYQLKYYCRPRFPTANLSSVVQDQRKWSVEKHMRFRASFQPV